MDHTIGKCEKFKELLQSMKDRKEVEFFKNRVEKSVNVITDVRTLTIFFEDESISTTNMSTYLPKLTVKMPSLFPYTDSKMVPKVVLHMINESITKKEASKFLKFIKHSEYSVVEQLNKLLTHISLLALLMNFEPNQKALMNVLSEAYVTYNILVKKWTNL